MKHIVLYILLLFALLTNAQDIKRTAIWYFGENAGIDFNTNPPTPLTDGKINSSESTTTICDTNGALQLYSDGKAIWNKYHEKIKGSDNLLGNNSSSNGVLILPKPNNDTLFYIFYTDAQGGANGFNYSIINLKGNNDSAIVITKNVKLLNSVCESITATKHQNGTDYWIIIHGFNDSFFYAFLLNDYGLQVCPKVSKSSFMGGSIFIAQNILKLSVNSEILANTFYDVNSKVEMSKFDNQSGLIIYKYSLHNLSLPSGVSFSTNNNFVYVNERDKAVNQYNISSNNETAINLTRSKIYTPVGYGVYGMQLSLNRKIYISSNGLTHLSCIKKPDSVGAASNFNFNEIDLQSKLSLVGLPNFPISNLHNPNIDFKYRIACKTNTIDFTGYDTISATTFKWYFTKNATTDSATTKNPTYSFADTGNYTITFIASNGNRKDTVTKNLYIHPKYTLNLGNDTVVCSTPYTLNAGAGQFCYTWQDSSSNSTFEVNQSGTYHVKVVTQNHCTQFDTIKVTVVNPPSKPIITRQNDTLLSSLANQYQWYFNNNPIPNANGQTYKVTQNGLYKVEITDTNGCKTMSDVFNFIYLGANTTSNTKQFRVYPNSITNRLYIQKPENIDIYQIKLTDLQGKALITKQLFKETEEIQLTAIATGVYLLQITINGKLQETHKLIKQH